MGMIKSLTDREFQKFKEVTDGSPAIQTFSMNQLIPEEFDAMNLSYSDSNVVTIEYLTGGTGGTVVATLNLTYTGSDVASVEKT